MLRWRRASYLALLVTAGLLAAAAPGNAHRARARRSTFGYVDLAKVTDAIKETAEWKANYKQFEDGRNRFRNEIEELAKLRFLSPAEVEELRFLRIRKEPTNQEKERIEQLERKSSRLDTEYQLLVAIEKPSETDMKRVKELAALREADSTAIQRVLERDPQVLQKQEGELLDRMQDRIRQLVRKVARKHRLAMVVDRQAVLDGGIDLTPEVLREVAKDSTGSRRR